MAPGGVWSVWYFNAWIAAKRNTCASCGATVASYEEKGTDVNIAVSLVADAALGAADIALLISADSDLCPAIRKARLVSATFGTRLGMIAAFPPARFSHEIRTLIPRAFTLAQADIRRSLLPDVVRSPDAGRLFHRPTKWR